MTSALPQKIYIEFDSCYRPHSPDWMELASNSCLFFFRTASGMNCKFPSDPEAKIQLTEKTHITALKVLAGFIAWTLWLPFTFIGLILCWASSSHASITDAAARNLLMPPPTPVQPQIPTPEPAPTPPSEEKPNENSSFAVPIDEFDFEVPDTKAPLLKALEFFQNDPSNPTFIADLKSMFSQMSDQEFMELQPEIVSTLRSIHGAREGVISLDWLPPKVCGKIASTLLKECTSENAAWLKRLVPMLWNKVFQNSLLEETNACMSETLKCIGSNPELLFSLYRTAGKSQGSKALFYQLIDNAQVTALVTHLHSTLKAHDYSFTDMVYHLAINSPKQTQQAIIDRIKLVPMALKEKPFEWINMWVAGCPTNQPIRKEFGVPLVYFCLDYTLQILQRPIKDGDDPILDRQARISEISGAISYTFNATHLAVAKGTLSEAPELPDGLSQLSDTLQPDHYVMLIEALQLAAPQDSTLLMKRKMHYMIGHLAELIMKSSHANRSADLVFPALISALTSCKDLCSQPYMCLTNAFRSIQTVDILHKAADAAPMSLSEGTRIFEMLYTEAPIALHVGYSHVNKYSIRTQALATRLSAIFTEATSLHTDLFPIIINYLFPLSEKPHAPVASGVKS